MLVQLHIADCIGGVEFVFLHGVSDSMHFLRLGILALGCPSQGITMAA